MTVGCAHDYIDWWLLFDPLETESINFLMINHLNQRCKTGNCSYMMKWKSQLYDMLSPQHHSLYCPVPGMMHNCSHSKSFWLLTWIVTKIRKVWFFESQSPLFPWLTGGRVETLSMEKGDGETTQVTERPFPRIWLRLRWKIFPFVLENILRRWIVTIEHS